MGAKGSFLDKFFNITPLGQMMGADNDTEPAKPPPDTAAIAASAAAREQERRRLASNGRPTVLSGRRTDALSASIGKRTLGGGA